MKHFFVIAFGMAVLNVYSQKIDVSILKEKIVGTWEQTNLKIGNIDNKTEREKSYEQLVFTKNDSCQIRFYRLLGVYGVTDCPPETLSVNKGVWTILKKGKKGILTMNKVVHYDLENCIKVKALQDLNYQYIIEKITDDELVLRAREGKKKAYVYYKKVKNSSLK